MTAPTRPERSSTRKEQLPQQRTPSNSESAPSAVAPRGLAQPLIGLVGLVIVLAAAALLGLAMGAQKSLEVVGPVSTFCLPVLAVSALWWGGWPVARASRLVGGLASTGIIIGGGILLTLLGEAVVGRFSPAHLFGTTVETPHGHFVTFPWTVPIACSTTHAATAMVCGQPRA